MKNNRWMLACSVVLGLSGISFASLADVTSTVFTIGGVIRAKTCSFADTTMDVRLPDVDTVSLAKNNVSSAKNFSIELNCESGVSTVSIIPTGMAVESGDTTLFRNTGTASNVGLRLYDSSKNVLTPDGKSKVTLSPNGDSNVLVIFSAAYAGTGSGRVNGGSFLSSVTLSLDYS